MPTEWRVWFVALNNVDESEGRQIDGKKTKGQFLILAQSIESLKYCCIDTLGGNELKKQTVQDKIWLFAH